MTVNAFDAKYLEVIAPAAIKDDGAYTTVEIDTLGFDYAEVIFHIGATDIAIATLAMQQSSTSGNGFADITGLIVGTSADIDGTTTVLPSATDDNTLVIFQIDLRDKERYLDLSATAGDGTAGTFASAICRLSRAAIQPNTVAEFGGGDVLRA